jgi:hypothetical protein
MVIFLTGFISQILSYRRFSQPTRPDSLNFMHSSSTISGVMPLINISVGADVALRSKSGSTLAMTFFRFSGRTFDFGGKELSVGRAVWERSCLSGVMGDIRGFGSEGSAILRGVSSGGRISNVWASLSLPGTFQPSSDEGLQVNLDFNEDGLGDGGDGPELGYARFK